MANTLVAVAASMATLTRVQFTKIEANLSSSVPVKTGEVTVTTEFGLKRNNKGTPDVLSEVTVEVVGISNDSKKGDAPAFTIKMSIHGVYTWETALDPSMFKGESLSSLLAKPLHVLIISEVHSLARRLGLQGVQLPWDLPTSSTATPRKRLSTPKKLGIKTVAPKAKPLLK